MKALFNAKASQHTSSKDTLMRQHLVTFFASVTLFLTGHRHVFSNIEFSEEGFYAASSLMYHASELLEQLDGREKEYSTPFPEEDTALLWEKVSHSMDHRSFQKAYDSYYHGLSCLNADLNKEALDALNHSINLLSTLKAPFEETQPPLPIFKATGSPYNLKNNPCLSSKVRKKISPFLLPHTNPIKNNLDYIFSSSSRVTTNDQTLLNAGFNIHSIQPRSYVRILSHPLVPDHLFKAYVDSELRKKKNKDSWEWLVKRCQGASAIRHIIQKKKFKFFTVPNKWIYPLPEKPSPPIDAYHTRHLALLVVTDMHLRSWEDAVHAWYHQITREHLDELYQIISYAKGSSYRPDNIALTINGTFAFIDTEYPRHKPDYASIKHYLSHEMRIYWENLIRKGGKQ